MPTDPHAPTVIARRYFRHVDGFRDGTRWMCLEPDGRVIGVAQDGREWPAMTYSAEDVIWRVKQGLWYELPATDLAAPAAVGREPHPLDLEAIKAREAKATKGPWREGIPGNQRLYGPDGENEASGLIASFTRRQDQSFIAHARTDIPALIAEVERLRSSSVPAAQIEQLQTYAMNWHGTEFGGLIERDKVLAILRASVPAATPEKEP